MLKQIHEDLDAAVLEAYGWQDLGRDLFPKGPRAGEREWSDLKAFPFSPPAPGRVGNASLPIADILARGGSDEESLEQQLLTRLVAINHDRAAEEKRGLIRWLRPD